MNLATWIAQNSEGHRLKPSGGDLASGIEIAVDRTAADAVVRLRGRIDVDSSPDVRDCLRTILLNDPPPQAVAVDLVEVTSIEASGIATLVESLRVARHRKIRFHLRAQGSVLQLFESAGFLALFDKDQDGKGA
ncbi:MAG TPA: STAS domain-containing protein [Candidatus Acidoferrales bacterium]|nr:STAS domain-containing protein [Candidatus Acidoferrales bacterium]